MRVDKVQMYVLVAAMGFPLSAHCQIPQQQPTNVSGMPLADGQAKTVNQSTPGAMNNNSSGMADPTLNGSVVNDMQLAKDKMFMRKATQGGLAEVQFGQLALQKGDSPEVKNFGQKMIDDHTAYDKELSSVADTLGIHKPNKLSKEDQEEYDKLNAMSGKDFDKAYLTMMLKDHRKDLREYRVEETSTTDPVLKDAVWNGEKVIAEHLRSAYLLAKANGIAVQRPAPPK